MRAAAVGIWLVALSAYAQDAGVVLANWDMAAKFWVLEVAEPELGRCIATAGGRGTVTITIDIAGNVSFELDNEDDGLAKCAALSAAKWSAVEVPHRYGGVPVAVSYPAPPYDTFGDPYPLRTRHEPYGACNNWGECGAGEVCDLSLSKGACVDLLAYLRSRTQQEPTPAPRAERFPERYATAAYLTGDLAAAIPVAAERLLGPQKKTKACLEKMESYRVHVSREGAFISVAFWPNTHCGEGIKGGGLVTLEAKRLKVVKMKRNE